MLRWVCLGWLCFVTVAWADGPQQVTASYDLYRGQTHIAVVEESYVRQGNTYRLSSLAKPVGLLSVFRPETIQTSSEGEVTTQGLRPLHHRYVREKDAARSSSAEFDWHRGQAALLAGGVQQILPLSAGTQDRLSGMYQFMFDTLRAGQVIRFSLVNGLGINMQRYAVSNGEHCTLGKEALATWYLDNQSKPGESRTEIWLARKYHALPCKIRMTEGNGTEYVQQLRSLVVVP